MYMLTKIRRHINWDASEAVQLHCNQGDSGYHQDKTVLIEVPPFEDYYEEMTPNSDGARKAWKDFEHFKTFVGDPSSMGGMSVHTGTNQYGHTYVGYAYSPYVGYRRWTSDSSYSESFGNPGRLDINLPAFYVKRDDGGFVPPPSDLSGLNARALRSMLPLIKAELSLPNSLYELKDFESLPRTLKGLLKLGKHAVLASRAVLRELVPKGADAYLQAEFNIKPLISDIHGIYRALSRVEKRINDFVTRAGRVQTKHWMFRWTEYSDSTDMADQDQWLCPSYILYPVDLYSLRRSVYYEPTEFHAEIEYNYNYTQYQLEHARVLALLDALGFNWNPAVIWNAIPWSFLVDWTIGVSRWLDQFKVALMEPQINIHRYLWSVKRKRRITCWKMISSRVHCAEPHTSEIRLPIVYQSAYRRQTGLPGRSTIELCGGLSTTQYTLGAALVITRRRHPKKPSTKRSRLDTKSLPR